MRRRRFRRRTLHRRRELFNISYSYLNEDIRCKSWYRYAFSEIDIMYKRSLINKSKEFYKFNISRKSIDNNTLNDISGYADNRGVTYG